MSTATPRSPEMWIGLLIDPAGNHIELLQYPPASPLAKYQAVWSACTVMRWRQA